MTERTGNDRIFGRKLKHSRGDKNLGVRDAALRYFILI